MLQKYKICGVLKMFDITSIYQNIPIIIFLAYLKLEWSNYNRIRMNFSCFLVTPFDSTIFENNANGNGRRVYGDIAKIM